MVGEVEQRLGCRDKPIWSWGCAKHHHVDGGAVRWRSVAEGRPAGLLRSGSMRGILQRAGLVCHEGG